MMTYPEYCIQNLEPSWWEENKDKKPRRGTLIETFIPFVDTSPYCFSMKGRTDPEAHNKAEMVVAPLKVGQSLKKEALPIAGAPLNGADVWGAYRAKIRPCLIISEQGDYVDRTLTKGKPTHATARTFLVAPFYGIKGQEKQVYDDSSFIEKVRHLEYKQFFWDKLPHSNGQESILRLDQIQPIGIAYDVHKNLGYKLNEKALEIMNDLLRRYIWDEVDKEGDLKAFRDLLSDYLKQENNA